MEYLEIFSETERILRKHDLCLLYNYLESVKPIFVGHYEDIGYIYYLSKFLSENNVPNSESQLLFSSDNLSDLIKNIKKFRKGVQRLNFCEEYSFEEFVHNYLDIPISSEELTWSILSSCTDFEYVLGRISGTIAAHKLPVQTEYFNPEISFPSKISFIICTTDDNELSESAYYIQRLLHPEHCKLDIISIHDAQSICAGYNEGMNSSESKYKIYLHQDVRIINPYFLYYILNIFYSNPSIGILGMVGANNFSSDGYMWHSPLNGSWIQGKPDVTQSYKSDMDKLMNLMLLDGFLLATQYDIQWRDDIFDGFHFYDASQCMEFIKAGYHVAVPYQENRPWCLHDSGWSDTKEYLEYSIKFKNEYKDLLRNCP